MALKSVTKVNQTLKELDIKNLNQVAYKTFKDETPIRTGNARRNTFNRRSEIHAAYPYAKRLDEGWSRQSPDGMVLPTIQAIRQYIKKIIG